MDKLTKLILKYVINNAMNEFVVVDYADIMQNLPKNLKCNVEDIKKRISHLQERGFINLKYSDDSVACVRGEVKGKNFMLQSEEQETNLSVVKKYLKINLSFIL